MRVKTAGGAGGKRLCLPRWSRPGGVRDIFFPPGAKLGDCRPNARQPPAEQWKFWNAKEDAAN